MTNTNINTKKQKSKRAKDLLKPSWFAERPIDAEHKFYVLKAFIQKVHNLKKEGFIVDAYKILRKRYKDLECFKSSYKLLNSDKETDELLKYIYSLPSGSDEHDELDVIVEQSLSLLRTEYMLSSSDIMFVFDNIDIVDENILDKRKKVNLYIEKCNTNIYEHFIIKRNNTSEYVESFMSFNFEPDKKENFVLIKSKVAYNSESVIIPILTEEEFI